ncbi:DUF4870 domain-containing protein [Flavobacterium sp. CS20]|uniref:DUF4870 domain-containing protein n=1 Tax=Flavobacterium sp. CS20 TaxID=2775246 RepID=UPI001FFC691F|nr:hypothetical protein [Flavobacterium sp. CS20]
MSQMSQNSKSPKGKTATITSYLFFFLGTIIALFMNMEDRHEFARFHIRQSFGLHFIFIAFSPLASGFDNWMISFSLYLFYTVLWFYGFINAVTNKTQPIPILGNFFQKLFKVL